ncbi:proline-rich nuclear receptor coactivator 2 [Tribolium madens]|uniref:proline-rich nuclear receptor coactivator 2 n=1 Tax=Tribolium madens TaxID=41895 RepID=UPI001CF7237E|nr:proline-rich nuclear receptor coactivator 2 [Tribolium madens]
MFIFRCKDSTVQKCVSAAAMARKNSDGGPRNRPKGPTTPRHSPVRGSAASPTGAGHYAGCKWTEPPLPSALPPPPQHWMQAPPHSRVLPFRQPKPEQHDIENQLKVLLKVQA